MLIVGQTVSRTTSVSILVKIIDSLCQYIKTIVASLSMLSKEHERPGKTQTCELL